MSLAGKRYLITGGLGFLGAALAKALVREGSTLRVYDNGWRGAEGRLGDAARDIEVVRGDVRDADSVAAAVRGMDAVCHFAFVNGTRFFYEKPFLVLEVAVKGVLNVLEACTKAGVSELFLASSSEVYQTPPSVPTDERVPLTVPDLWNPRYSYGGGKIISELLAVHCGRDHLERVVIFRPHNVYGPDMGWEHVIPEFVVRMKALCRQTSGPVAFPIQGTGWETRAFIFIEDFTDGLLRVIRGGEHLGVYNIGTMEEISVETVAREVGRYFGREISIVQGELRAGSTSRRCPDTTKIQALGFVPHYTFREGLRLTAKWYDENADRRLKPEATEGPERA